MSSSLALRGAGLGLPAGMAPPPPATSAATFKDYVLTRKYDFGRGTAEAWGFVAWARGQSELPDVRSWRELRAYLEAKGASPALQSAARKTWRSFKALQSRAGRGCPDC